MQGEVINAFSQSYLDCLKTLRKDAGKGWGELRRDSTRGRLQRFLDSVAAEYGREGMLDRWAPGKGKKRRLDLKGRPDKLQAVTDADMTDAGHPFRAARFIELGCAPRVLVAPGAEQGKSDRPSCEHGRGRRGNAAVP